jgi:hypothetical protein
MPLFSPVVRILRPSIVQLILVFPLVGMSAQAAGELEGTRLVVDFIDNHCTSCHDDVELKGELDLTSLNFNPNDPNNLSTWIKVYDRASSGEMPPKKKTRPDSAELATFTHSIANSITAFEQEHTAMNGRAHRRRLNRDEYENVLRDLLHAPWLQLKALLSEDQLAHHYTKSGDTLDMSHVQLITLCVR